jgi:hypothetical protein
MLNGQAKSVTTKKDDVILVEQRRRLDKAEDEGQNEADELDQQYRPASRSGPGRQHPLYTYVLADPPGMKTILAMPMIRAFSPLQAGTPASPVRRS